MKVSREVSEAIEHMLSFGQAVEHGRARAPIAETISEKDFQAAVIKEAKANGWMIYHTYNSIKSNAGFFDLVLVHAARHMIVFAELKRQSGLLSAAQLNWFQHTLEAAIPMAGMYVVVWRPSDWEKIMDILKGTNDDRNPSVH